MKNQDWEIPQNLQPDPDDYSFDLERSLRATVNLKTYVPPDAFTAGTLGTERAGSGVVIRESGLVATIGYLITEAETIWITSSDGRAIPGHALAYDAGAALMDMEFVQFHPTGMIWPPSVRGILVTEGVRGEGGVLRNRNGERVLPVVGVPGVISLDHARQAARETHDTGDLPAPDDLICPAGHVVSERFSFPERQFVDDIRIQLLAQIEIR